jgi:hypothetical protein
MRDMLRQTWHAFTAWDQELHTKLLLRFPRFTASLERILEAIIALLRDPVFAILFTLVFIVLGIAKVELVVLVSIYLGWVIAFIWITRFESIRKLTIISRTLVLFVIGSALAFVGQSFGHWAIRQHSEEEAKVPKSSASNSDDKVSKMRELYVQLSKEQTEMANAYANFYASEIRYHIVYVDLKNPTLTKQDREEDKNLATKYGDDVDMGRNSVYKEEEKLSAILAEIKTTFDKTKELDVLILSIENGTPGSYVPSPIGPKQLGEAATQQWDDAEGPKATEFYNAQRKQPIANLLGYLASEIDSESNVKRP